MSAQELFERLAKRIDGYRDYVIEMETELTARPALAPPKGKGEAAKAAFIEEHLRSLGVTDIAHFDGFGHRSVIFWDFAGQVRFTNLWQSLLKGTRIAILMTDSTYENVTASKKILEDIIYKYYPDIKVIAIANKQDLENRLSEKFVGKILGVPTYSMISINEQYRVKIHEILKDLIDEINKEDGLKRE